MFMLQLYYFLNSYHRYAD